MIIHLVPRLYNRVPVHAEILDVSIPELNLTLRGGTDIVARRPYPNKGFQVPCRKVGQRAINGVLVESPTRLAKFTSVTRWAVNAELVVRHEVEHIVLDSDFDAVTEDMVLWYAQRDRANRWPIGLYPNCAPVHVQPRLDLMSPTRSEGGDSRRAECQDQVSDEGIVLLRNERFKMPTIERDRLQAGGMLLTDRLPPWEHIFRP